MNAMQRFKERTGKPFPTYGEVIKVAVTLGYRRLVDSDQPCIRRSEFEASESSVRGIDDSYVATQKADLRPAFPA